MNITIQRWETRYRRVSFEKLSSFQISPQRNNLYSKSVTSYSVQSKSFNYRMLMIDKLLAPSTSLKKLEFINWNSIKGAYTYHPPFDLRSEDYKKSNLGRNSD